MRQLLLPLDIYSQKLVKNLVANELIINFMDSLFAVDEAKIVYIYGIKGSGKTNILQSYCYQALDIGLSAAYIKCDEFEINNNTMLEFNDYDWLFVDDIHLASEASQYGLFTLYNNVKFTKLKLIISGDMSPKLLNLRLKDLKTRLSMATVLTLDNLNDEQKKQVLIRENAQKNININSIIYDYLLRHYSRNLDDLLVIIDKLNKYSMQEHKNLSINLVKKFLSNYSTKI